MKCVNCKKNVDDTEDFTIIRMTDLLIDNIHENDNENDAMHENDNENDAEGSFINPVFDDNEEFEHIYI